MVPIQNFPQTLKTESVGVKRFAENVAICMQAFKMVTHVTAAVFMGGMVQPSPTNAMSDVKIDMKGILFLIFAVHIKPGSGLWI